MDWLDLIFYLSVLVVYFLSSKRVVMEIAMWVGVLYSGWNAAIDIRDHIYLSVIYYILGVICVLLVAACKEMSTQTETDLRPEKKKALAVVLSFFFGGVGLHKVYLGRHGWGALYFLFFWTGIPVVLGIIDCLILLFMRREKFVVKYSNNQERTINNTDKTDTVHAERTKDDGESVHYENVPITIGNFYAEGEKEHFRITIFDRDGHKYEFMVHGGSIVEYKDNNMKSFADYNQ